MTTPPLEALFRPALVLMTGRFLGFLAAFAIPMVLVRVFDQTEFGTYKQLFLVFGTLFGIFQVGMAESLYYFLPSKSNRAGSYVVNSLIVMGTLGALAAMLLWLGRGKVALLLNNPDLAEYLPLIGLYLVFMLMAVVLEIVMTVRKQHLAASSMYAVSDLTRAIFSIAPVLLFADLRWLLWAGITFAASRFATMLVYIRREFGRNLRMDATVLKRQLGYAIPFGIAGLIEILQMNFHLYVVSYYFDAAVFAIYAVGCLQIPLMEFLMTSTCNVMMVNMQEKVIAGDEDAVVSIWLDSVRKLALIYCPLIAGLLVTAHELIILLFTSAYEESIPIFMVWSASMLFSILMTDGALRVFAETRFLILQNLIRLGLIITLIQWFLQHFNLIGAILVTLMATAVAKACALWRLKIVMNVGISRLLPWKSLAMVLLIAGGAAVPAIGVKALLAIADFPLFLLTGCVYVLTYYLLLQRFGPMQDDEKAMLSQWLTLPYDRLLRVCRNTRYS